jgi:hypothetical protein
MPVSIMRRRPFAITQEAEAQIEMILLDAQQDLTLLAMARVLGYASNCSWAHAEGGGGGWYPFAHVVLGWHPFEEVIGNNDYTELVLGGFRVFAGSDMLAIKPMAR